MANMIIQPKIKQQLMFYWYMNKVFYFWMENFLWENALGGWPTDICKEVHRLFWLGKYKLGPCCNISSHTDNGHRSEGWRCGQQATHALGGNPSSANTVNNRMELPPKVRISYSTLLGMQQKDTKARIWRFILTATIALFMTDNRRK